MILYYYYTLPSRDYHVIYTRRYNVVRCDACYIHYIIILCRRQNVFTSYDIISAVWCTRACASSVLMFYNNIPKCIVLSLYIRRA